MLHPQVVGGLAPLDPAVEALLAGPSKEAGPAGSLPVTLVLGLPGADQSLVAASLCSALAGGKAAARVALLPGTRKCEGVWKSEGVGHCLLGTGVQHTCGA